MMKIELINALNGRIRPERKAPSKEGFDEILLKTADKLDGPGQVQPDTGDSSCFAAGARLLDALERLSEQMADPFINDKGLGPVADQVRRAAEEAGAAAMAGTDAELNGILKEITLLANVALAKYDRGDFA